VTPARPHLPSDTDPFEPLVRLTDLLGRRARVAEGDRLGTVADLIARLDAEPGVVELVVRSGHDRAAVPWRDVVAAGDDIELVADHRGAPAPPGRKPDELRLGTDVLDAQIVDLRGHRLVRVSEVLLTRRVDGSLAVVGVDIGFAAVVRRLGLRRISERFGRDVVAWSDLHLTSRRGHAVQLACGLPHLRTLSADDLAHLVTRLSAGHAAEVLRATPVDQAAAAVAATEDEVGRRLLTTMEPDDARQLLDTMPPTTAHRLRHLLSRTPVPRRRYQRTRGWKRHAPTTPSAS